MALFESGWDTKSSNSALVRNSAPSAKAKKRDPAASEAKMDRGANIDLDKLLKRMTDIGGEVKDKRKGNEKGGRKGKAKDGGVKEAKQSVVSSKERGAKEGKEGKEGKSKERTAPSKPNTGDTGGKKRKRKEKERDDVEAATGDKRKSKEHGTAHMSKSKKQKHEKEEPRATGSDPIDMILSEAEGDKGGEMSELQKLVKKNLQGSKFRIINEKLYKSSSQDAQAMMNNEPETYTEYHIGFRHQTKSWPLNPIDLISTSLSTLPPRSIIADLGCGDAHLAKSLSQLNVISFDLVSDNTWVVQADICTHIPLPGDEAAIVDACVCSLSLMSTNWVGCASEAWRVLRIGGRFVVAEVTSRFRDSKAFCKVLSDVGFELIEQSAPSTHFLMFEFRKVQRKEIPWKDIESRAEGLLKPCEYKRR